MLTIGGAGVSSPIWLAPLAGISSETFRAWHRSAGAGLTHTEMASALGLIYASKKTKRLLGPPEEPGPLALQLFGPDAASVARGAEIALGVRDYCAIEVNMACPMPKVARKGSGAALLSNPGEAEAMIRALAPFGLPVWAKMRITGPEHPLSSEAFAGRLLGAGASFVMIHGRTPAQRYEGAADREAVIAVARAFPGMIGASGDVTEPQDAVGYLDGGAAAVLAARGAIRDAYLITRANAALGLAGADFAEPSTADRARAVLSIGRLGMELEGEAATLALVRRMLAGLFRGFAGAARLRQICSATRSWGDFENYLNAFIEEGGRQDAGTGDKRDERTEGAEEEAE